MRKEPSSPALSPEGYAAYRARRHFGSLDGIRALAIVAVVWHHSHPPALFNGVGERGFLGVDMFFVLSGFLIVTLLLRERGRRRDISLKDFYARRSLRIFPLYYGVIALVALMALARPDGETASNFWSDLPYLLTYTTNWVLAAGFLEVTWSLAAEEQFYVVWPSLEKLGRRFSLVVLGVLLVLSQLIALHALDPVLFQWFGLGPDEPAFLRQATFTPILLGVGLAHLLHSPRGFAAARRALGARWASPLLAAALCVFLLFVPRDIQGWPRLGVHLLMVAFLASCVVDEEHGLAPLFRSRPLVRLGVLSYGIYLLHMLVEAGVAKALGKVDPSLTGGPIFFAVLLAGSYLVAELSYRYYEQRFLRMKERFRRQPTAAAEPKSHGSLSGSGAPCSLPAPVPAKSGPWR